MTAEAWLTVTSSRTPRADHDPGQHQALERDGAGVRLQERRLLRRESGQVDQLGERQGKRRRQQQTRGRSERRGEALGANAVREGDRDEHDRERTDQGHGERCASA